MEAEIVKRQVEATDAAIVLSKEYSDKLFVHLDKAVVGRRTALNRKLRKIGKNSEQNLKAQYAASLTKLQNFNTENPKAKEIYEVVKPFFEKKNEIKGISEMQLATYARNSGYHKVIDAKFTTLGLDSDKIKAIQKHLGIKVDGKVGPKTINALSGMLGLGMAEVKFEKKTVLADGTEVDNEGNNMQKPEEKKEGEEEVAEVDVYSFDLSEVENKMDAIRAKCPDLYACLQISSSLSNNTITITRESDSNTESSPICRFTMDPKTGKITDDSNTPITNIDFDSSFEKRIENYARSIKEYWESGSGINSKLECKFPGELAIHKYTFGKLTNIMLGKKVLGWKGDALEVDFVIAGKTDADHKPIGKVLITKNGAVVQPVDGADVVLSVANKKIVAIDRSFLNRIKQKNKPAVAEVSVPEANTQQETPAQIFATAQGAAQTECANKLYTDGNFKLTADVQNRTVTLEDPNQYPEGTCHETQIFVLSVADDGKVLFDGVVINSNDVASKISEKTKKYLNDLEYYEKLDDNEDDLESLAVKFKGELKTNIYYLNDNDHFSSRTIKKVKNNIVVSYSAHEEDPCVSGRGGAIKKVDLARFTISKGGNVKKWLNPSYKSTVEVNVTDGKITIENKEEEEPSVADSN